MIELRKHIRDVQEKVTELVDRKPVAILLSLLAALVVWFAIVVNVYPQTPLRFYSIPVEVELKGTTAEANGLSVVDIDVESVNAELVGARSQIGRLTTEDLIASVDVDSVNTAGEYTLPLTIRAENGIGFNVDAISPATATVRFDKIETRPFDVTPSYPNIVVTAGHATDTDDVTCEPSFIEITGPSAQLDEIARVEVYSGKSQELDSSYSFYASEIRLYTEEGALLDTEDLDIPTTDFQISIPVLTQKELQLTYEITGATGDFDLDWLRSHLTLSEDSITLAAQTSSALAKQESWSMGIVSLRDIEPGFSRTFSIDMDEGLINRSGIDQVTMTLDDEDIVTKNFTVSSDNLSITNPGAYDFNIITRKMEITVAGPKEELDELDVNDICVQADLLNYNAEQQGASFSWTPVITFYDQKHLWAVGSYKISIDRIDTDSSADDTADES